MSLLDDLSKPTRVVPFKEWLIAQPSNTRKRLDEAALDRFRWSDTALEKLLRKHGASCSLDSIRAWRADVAAR